METLSPQETPNALIFDSVCIQHLKTTRKWVKFISIAGFIFIGFMVVGGLTIFLTRLSALRTRSFLTMVPMVFLGLIYLFPVYYLWQFSKYSKLAIEENSGAALRSAFNFLRRHYTFMGILLIIIIVMYTIIWGLMLLQVGGHFFTF